MTLTLNVPQDVQDDAQRERLTRAAIALYDARLMTQGQAAALAGMGRVEFINALINSGISVIQYDSAEEILAEANTLTSRA